MSTVIVLDNLLIPRLTTAQRDAITPVNGMRIYNTTDEMFEWYENGMWTANVSGVTDHGGLTGLSDDDHAQYVLLLGRAGGQDIIGGTGVNDDLKLRASSNAGGATVVRIDNQKNQALIEILRLQSQRATRADDDELFMSFYQPTSSGATREFGRITSKIQDVTVNVHDGSMEFDVARGGALLRMLDLQAINISGEGVVHVNPTQDGNVDFQVSGTLLNLFRTDANVNAIGIGGTPSQASMITIDGGAANRLRASGIGMALNFPADTFTQTNTGTLAIGTMLGVDIPTFAATGAATLTDAATLYIQGAPVAGANMTITNPWAVWLDGGTLRIDETDAIALFGDDNYLLANGVRMMNLSTSIQAVMVNPTSGANQRLVVRNQTNDSEVLNVITSTVGQRVQMSARDTTASRAVLEILKQTNAASVKVLEIKGDRNFATPGQAADGDEIYVTFQLEDDANASHEFARITAIASDVSNGSEAGVLEFGVSCGSSGGTFLQMFHLDGDNNEIVFNPGNSGVVDLRMSAGHFLGAITDFLFVDSSQAAMVIGGGVTVATQNTPLSVHRTLNEAVTSIMRLESFRSVRADGNELQMNFLQPSDNGTSSLTGQIINTFVDVTTASRDSAFRFTGMRAGAVRDLLRFGHTTAGVFEWGFDQTVATRDAYTATTQGARNADTATTVALLQDVVQTLIDDLKSHGVFV